MFLFFFFNDTATTEIYTLSLHDALPICISPTSRSAAGKMVRQAARSSADMPFASASHCALTVAGRSPRRGSDRKSTRLNSSHLVISYAVFCLKKKKNYHTTDR